MQFQKIYVIVARPPRSCWCSSFRQNYYLFSKEQYETYVQDGFVLFQTFLDKKSSPWIRNPAPWCCESVVNGKLIMALEIADRNFLSAIIFFFWNLDSGPSFMSILLKEGIVYVRNLTRNPEIEKNHTLVLSSTRRLEWIRDRKRGMAVSDE